MSLVSHFAVESDAGNYLRLIGAVGNLAYKDEVMGSMVESMDIKINMESLKDGNKDTMKLI